MFKLDKTLCVKSHILFQTWHRKQYAQVNRHDVIIKNEKASVSLCRQ